MYARMYVRVAGTAVLLAGRLTNVSQSSRRFALRSFWFCELSAKWKFHQTTMADDGNARLPDAPRESLKSIYFVNHQNEDHHFYFVDENPHQR
jgi:hypothetical protein